MITSNNPRIIYIRKDLKRELEDLLSRLTGYNIITFDKGDARIVLIHGIHVLFDEDALRVLTHLPK